MFSLTVEYALRAAVYLADTPGRRATAQEVASECKVPVSYMSKVLQALTEAGLVTSQRGPSGGFALAHDPSRISMFDVIDVISPVERVHSCPLDMPEHSHQLCPLHHELDALAADTTTRLKSRTLADLSESRPTSVPISGLPTVQVGHNAANGQIASKSTGDSRAISR